MDKLLQQMKEEWERMTPEQKKAWKKKKEWMNEQSQKLLDEMASKPLTEEQKRYFAWMDSVEDGSYQTEEDKKRIQELADSI